MNSKKKGLNAVLFLTLALLLSNTVSATDLTFNTMFPECSSNKNDLDTSLRCACYFMIPNFHFEALWNLVIDASIGSIGKSGEYLIEQIWNIATKDIPNDVFTLNIQDLLIKIGTLFFVPLMSVGVLLYGIFSSVFVYLLLITFEFVKTYLIIAVSWCLWSELIFKEIKAGFLTNAGVMSFVIVAILVVGSILLLSFDITIWGAI